MRPMSVVEINHPSVTLTMDLSELAWLAALSLQFQVAAENYSFS